MYAFLQVDVLCVKELPAFYGNFLFGQYDLFGQSQPTVFYSEDHSEVPPCDNECEISVDFNHCQVNTYVHIYVSMYYTYVHAYRMCVCINKYGCMCMALMHALVFPLSLV